MTGKGPTLSAAAIISLVITTVAVVLRFYTRIVILRKTALDDYIILFCQITFLGFVIGILGQVSHGFGDHLSDIIERNQEDLVIITKWFWAGQHLFVISACTIKFAIVHFFFSFHLQRLQRYLAIFGVVLALMSAIGLELWQIFQCTPIKYFWTRMTFKQDASGSCFDRDKSFALLEMFTVMDILSDASLAIIPCTLVWNMKLNAPKKIGVCILLSMGVLSTISPFVRLFYLKDLIYKADDFTYSSWVVVLTVITEPATAITAISLVQLRPLLRKVLPQSWQSNSNRDHQPKDLNCPATFGGAGKRPKRRTFGMSLLESTRATSPTIPRHVSVASVWPSDGENSFLNDKKIGRSVYQERAQV